MTGFKGIPLVWDYFLNHFIFLQISLAYIAIETNHIFLILGIYLIKTVKSLMNERYCEEDVVQRSVTVTSQQDGPASTSTG